MQKYIQKPSKNQEKVSLGTLPGTVRNTATTAKTQGTLLALIFDRKSMISGCEIDDFWSLESEKLYTRRSQVSNMDFKYKNNSLNEEFQNGGRRWHAAWRPR